MAIASAVIQTHADDLQRLLLALQAAANVSQVQQAASDKIAAIIECPSDRLLRALEDIRAMHGVWNLELVYVNYEDDMDEDGNIPCPPMVEMERKKS